MMQPTKRKRIPEPSNRNMNTTDTSENGDESGRSDAEAQSRPRITD
jgi:hypothetical protein